MPDAAPLPAQIGDDAARPRHEVGETRVGRADHAPHQAEDQQPADRNAQPAMPDDQVAADQCRTVGRDDEQHQRPVENARGDIPHKYLADVHGLFLLDGPECSVIWRTTNPAGQSSAAQHRKRQYRL